MKGRRIFSAVLLVILLMCGGSDSGFFVYAEDSDSLSATETQIDDNKEENIEKEEHTDTQKECNKSKKSDDEQSIDKKEEKPEDRQQEDIESGEEKMETPAEEDGEVEKGDCDEKKLANQVVAIEKGKILKEDGCIEYGSPEGGQEFVESHVEPAGEMAEYFDRYIYCPSEFQVMPMSESVTNITANIRKRTQWTDKSNGNGKITLQYSSDSGRIQGMEDMNVVLIQDKSGSMDANYGYNLEVTRQGFGGPWDVKNYPIQNTMGWAETVSDIAAEENYFGRLTYKEPDSGYGGFNGNWLHNGEMKYNSPCQVDDHYYLLIENDDNSGLPAWTMTHGNNLYNTFSTDLHHYIKITRDQAVNTYLPRGRRVVRMTEGVCYTEQRGQEIYVSEDNPLYFLDVSQIINYNGGWILNTCAPGECQVNDRLARSQDFMDTLVTQIQALNPENKVAYVPFWGDVPNNGSWSNASSLNEQNGLYTDNEDRMTYKSGVGKINFTKNGRTIQSQIDNPFTYDGTNWSRAVQNAIDFLNNQSGADKIKKTLVIFLTDGMPQGTKGKAEDVNNPYINGINEIAKLKDINGVTVYACGVGVNERDQTGLASRLNHMDSTGTAVNVRYNDQFEELKTTILRRINQQYVIDIEGRDAIYTDTLSEPFTLDESRLDASWKVLASQGSGTIKGVPADVYNAAKAGAKAIYVRSTKTVYWYIGAMTDGGYTASGHEFSFPVQYADYQKATDGKDKTIESNTVQKLTYVTTQNLNQLLTRSMSTPSIIFSRQEKPGITVNKTVSGASFTEDVTYRFVYSTKKQTSGKVKGYTGEIYVTVKTGHTSGSAVIPNVNPGIYYVYEVDKNDNIISAQIETVKVSENAELTTAETGGNVLPSVRSSDGAVLSNLDNVLRITTKGGSVSFKNEYVKVDVTKIWQDENYAKRPKEVTIRLLRNDTEIQSMKLSVSNEWKGSFVNLEKYDAGGNAYKYSITEDEVIGYKASVSQSKEYEYTVTNKLIYGNVKLKKLDTDGKTPLPGTVFELKNNVGTVIAEKTTDEKGGVVFENLYPGGYTITETKTIEGHMLLKEPLLVEVPLQVTEADIVEMGIDKEKCIYYPGADVYLIYDYTYEITNHAAFAVPMTGGVLSVGIYVRMVLGMLVMAGAALLLLQRRTGGKSRA
ncbi:Cna B-type domain-containing protein [Mediterraneibacter agrestimuris]|uniref:Cna B-type domain-containing protein n=1 Tax=Mediterraneibacter agrestimuris TaxID=2941333 RepID=UPI00203EBE1D|nr:Cna B-type domain-containing protein [Mediterraneibacter agrestimuris]